VFDPERDIILAYYCRNNSKILASLMGGLKGFAEVLDQRTGKTMDMFQTLFPATLPNNDPCYPEGQLVTS
jgi:hypothetical protein